MTEELEQVLEFEGVDWEKKFKIDKLALSRGEHLLTVDPDQDIKEIGKLI